MADFKLPFSAGVESSSVSFDPRRQVAPAGDNEVTQVTQSGGRPALDVGNTIQQQFSAGQPGPSADAFSGAETPAPGTSDADLDQAAAQRVSQRKAVFAEYAKKTGDSLRLKKKAATDGLKKAHTKKLLDARANNEKISKDAQAKRQKTRDTISQAEQQHLITTQVKATTAKTTDVRTTNTNDTQVKTADVKANVDTRAQTVAAVADPIKKQDV